MSKHDSIELIAKHNMNKNIQLYEIDAGLGISQGSVE